MKTIKKSLISFVFLGSFSLFSASSIQAADPISDNCHYNPKPGVNPDFNTMNCLLTETALSYDIPPEIVKAIAEGESANWRQFDDKGNTIITEDNGIGVMQVTNQANYKEELLKTDVVYNIKAGVEILDQMFARADLPKINGGERGVLEHWYFAIMAYNGIKPINSPISQATGERNSKAYQEKVIQKINDLGLIRLSELPFKKEDFDYDPNSSENIKFVTKHYQFDLPLTKTKHKFIAGQTAETITAVNFRSGPTTGSPSKGTLSRGERITISGPFEYDKSVTGKNHFVWYPATRSNGSKGYVASSYLDFRFKDVSAEHYATDAIYYLTDRNILHGVSDYSFGLKEPLTRWQAVLLLTRANNVSFENRPDPGFLDVPKTYKYYNAIAAAVDEGIFTGVTEKEFEPNSKLTRAQMAKLLQRLYSFPETDSGHPFTDVKANAWYTDSIVRMYNAGITGGVTKTEFQPHTTVTREQFAVFLTRAMNPDFRIK